MSSNNQQAMNDNNNICKDFKDFIKGIIDKMPLFIRIVIFSTIILYITNLIIPFISFILSDIPYYTLFYVNIWRLITNSFMTTGLLSIIFSLIFWYSDAVKLEKEIGTIKYMLIFLMNTLCIQVLYCTLMLILSLITQNKSFLKLKMVYFNKRPINSGLWPIAMCDLTLLCLSNPESSKKLFLLPCIVKAKYYPLFLLLLFSIINGLDYELFCAIGFGYLYHYFLKNKLYIGNIFAIKVENFVLFRWMKNQKSFINIDNIKSPEIINNTINVANDRNAKIDITRVNGKAFRAFKGKGITVGSNEEDKNKNNINKENNNSIDKTINITDSTSSSKNSKDSSNTANKDENKNNYIELNNDTISSNQDMINSSDSRIELNTSIKNP